MQETTFEKEREIALREAVLVVGVDEAGRGPLAGPVVACATTVRNIQFLNSNFQMSPEEEKKWKLVRDSKTLSEKQREEMFDFIHEHFYVGIGIVHADTIDRINILEATFLAMKSAISQLMKNIPVQHENHGRGAQAYVLVDGNQEIPNVSLRQETVVGGDGTVKSIAAASIVAKVTRDRMIVEYDKQYPEYGLAQHKGYGTKVHMDALRKYGPTPIHRMSFKPVLLYLPQKANKRLLCVVQTR